MAFGVTYLFHNFIEKSSDVPPVTMMLNVY